MKLHEPEELEAGFEQSWKRWAARPPGLDPAEAASRIRRVIAGRSAIKTRPWLWPCAAAIVIAMVGIVLVRVPRGPEPESIQDPLRKSFPLGEGQVLFWIDDKTPLYMTFRRP